MQLKLPILPLLLIPFRFISSLKMIVGQSKSITHNPSRFQKFRKLIQPLDSVYESVKDYDIICIGEASHGTREFYKYRCELTKQLIQNAGLKGVMIEGDWPDSAQLHRFVMGHFPSMTIDEALAGFARFPRWMWRNTEMREFLVWLKEFNSKQPIENRCGIFGLDVYSLHISMEAVVDYLEQHDPSLSKKVGNYYSCFDRFGSDPQTYGMLTSFSLSSSCHGAAAEALSFIAHRTAHYASEHDGIFGSDEAFINEMNARVVISAETYYRSLFQLRTSSWEIRDTHFFDTVERVRENLLETRGSNKIALWAHNSHLGNAAFTNTGRQELNVGQLIKENHPDISCLIGQLTYTGEVTASNDWGKQHETKRVKPGMENSYEKFLHEMGEEFGLESFSLNFTDSTTSSEFEAATFLQRPPISLERAIGVIYRPDTERQSHYFPANIAKQFDLITWFDKTSAVVPLDGFETPDEEEETFPSGI